MPQVNLISQPQNGPPASRRRVPILMGFAEDELWSFMHALYPLSEAGYRKQLAQNFGARAAKVAALYPASDFPHIEYALGAALGDATMIRPAMASADTLAGETRVSVYEFADRSVPPFKLLGTPEPRPPGYSGGASHTAELQYLYNYQAANGPLSAKQRRLGDRMIAMWVGFNRTVVWPAYSDQDWVVMRLGANGSSLEPSTDVYAAHKCGFWNAK